MGLANALLIVRAAAATDVDPPLEILPLLRRTIDRLEFRKKATRDKKRWDAQNRETHVVFDPDTLRPD